MFSIFKVRNKTISGGNINADNLFRSNLQHYVIFDSFHKQNTIMSSIVVMMIFTLVFTESYYTFP